jgi:hypothetical protein
MEIMFNITLSPTASNKNTIISVSGKTLTYDGTAHDFTALESGAEVNAESPAIGLIKNVGGVIHITLEYHYDLATAEPEQSTDAADYIVELSNGTLQGVITRKAVNNV